MQTTTCSSFSLYRAKSRQVDCSSSKAVATGRPGTAFNTFDVAPQMAPWACPCIDVTHCSWAAGPACALTDLVIIY